MGYDYMDDPYYNPEKFGLTSVGEVEWSSGCYEFDLTAVWRRADGSLVYGEDAGCSCPSPFESVKADDLIAVTPAELQAHLDDRNKRSYDGDRSAQIAELMGRVNG